MGEEANSTPGFSEVSTESSVESPETADADVATPETQDTVASEAPAADDGGLFGDGPESDQEMPLTQHIEEMMRRLGVVFLFGAIATIIAFPAANGLIDYLWNSYIPEIPGAGSNRPHVYGPLELILTRLKIAGLAGVIAGIPVFVYQTYGFMRPGLYPRERRYYLAAIPTSLVLAVVGAAFSHFLVLPFIFDYFTVYTTDAATVAFGLKDTFNLIVLLTAYMSLVFQIPLFIMLAVMMNLVTREWMEDKRLLFWGAFSGISFIATPDPTGMAPIIVAITMIVLFEGTLALLRWTGN
jgi:sec-independent protein translocase protein TatC